MSQKSKDAAASKKIRKSFGDLSNQSKKRIYKRRGQVGCLFKKSNKKSLLLFSVVVITIIIYIHPIYIKVVRTRKTKALWGTSARGADAPSHPTAPGLLLSVFREHHAEERERERERKARVVSPRKKKEKKRGVTKRRVEVRILASLAHHE